ncbi:IucA/IucC family protein [Vibrio tapetis]|uniref:Siderophore synthetase component n=1 Tax=Vibrio tapetis subsp. tapetis TaxID=1671868 RepID=A0A2N8ZHN7_9VIBR|nr:IucA/IucC family protein [Vibrio tapetis]SON51415.1 Siderophore synthetase component [Vibrio tapetis subsp. tapetis]
MFNYYAIEQVTQDLIDCLLAEEFFGELALFTLSSFTSDYRHLDVKYPSITESIWKWNFDLAGAKSIIVALQPAITQRWKRIAGTPVYLCRDNQAIEEISPQVFLELALQGVQNKYQDNAKGMKLFKDVLAISLRQTALSQQHNISSTHLLSKNNAGFFLAMEQWASLRDRPYHPLAKAKQGLCDADYLTYQAEFGEPITLNWVAVRKDWLRKGTELNDAQPYTPKDFLLPSDQLAVLDAELNKKEIDSSHVALPVHPWQYDNILEQQLGEHFSNNTCIRLDYSSDNFFATSSLRSMTPCFDSCDHLKLPMAIYSLGASRYLPAVKMINGEFSESLLREAQKRDSALANKMHLCEEGRWWAFMPPNATLFDEAPRHLSAMVRRYPQPLLNDTDTKLLPMAALGTQLLGNKDHFFNEWLAYRQLEVNTRNVSLLFNELCHCFFEVNLRMFKLGMVAEVHGQNAVLVFKKGQTTGLLLRDHDSLRICVPELENNGLEDPKYCIKPGHANTLYHDTPEALLFWLQTLGIQVNMRSIIETLSLTYNIEESKLWTLMENCILEQINVIDFSDRIRSIIIETLFEKETWPQKYLLSPMIDRAGGPGSMPFGKGDVVNPFIRAKTLRVKRESSDAIPA